MVSQEERTSVAKRSYPVVVLLHLSVLATLLRLKACVAAGGMCCVEVAVGLVAEPLN
jgi:hypothetical protein